jgi:tripartite-type tricarboxylate transporter receptor subunit TctC
VDDPGNFSVHAESPIKSLKELADYARSKPGEVTVGTTGIGSDDHLAMLLFQKIVGVKLNHIPMKGAADVKGAIIGRQIDVAAMNIGEAMQAAAGGAPMRQLGQMSLVRTNLAPGVPTFAEQGIRIEMASLRGMAAPKGLPPEVRAQLVKAIERAAADPEFQAKAVQYYAPLRYLGPAEFDKVFKQTEEDFRKLWTEIPWSEK